MTANDTDTMTKLSERAKQAEANVKSANARQRADLQGQVSKARDKSKQNAEELSQRKAAASEDASEHWETVKSSWNNHVQDLHDKAADKKAQVDQRLAQRDADSAEDYAAAAVQFALAAIDEAEYAVLDAVLARADADDLAGSP